MTTTKEMEKIECKNKVEYKASVSNGWTKEFLADCGSFGDGIKRFCEECKLLTLIEE